MRKEYYEKYGKTGIYKCKLCGKSYSNISSLTSHLRNIHKQGTRKGENWEHILGKGKRPYNKKHPVITPEMKYMDIPVMLRIPIVVGRVQIVSTEEK